MDAYRKAKDFEEKQQYDDALESLLESLQEPSKNNPKRESAIKDVAAILHKLGSTQKAIEFLYKHRFEMANVPQFLNFTANLMFQFEPRPDDAYPRVLVIKPPYEFARLMCIKECEALVFEMFKYHRFKIESVVINEDEDEWRTIHVVFETHSSARKAALHWSKSHLDQLLLITWPNDVPIDLVDKKEVPERMIVETGIDAGAFGDVANSHAGYALDRCKILLITPERLKLVTPDHASSMKTEPPSALRAQPDQQKRQVAVDSDGMVDSEVEADNEKEVEKVDEQKVVESGNDLITWSGGGDSAKVKSRSGSDARGSGDIEVTCTSADNLKLSADNDNEDLDASPRLPQSVKCGFAVPEHEEENRKAVMAVPTPYPTKTTRFARTSTQHSRRYPKYEYVPKDSVVRFKRVPTPHPKKSDAATFEYDAATKSVQFDYSPTPHPKKTDNVRFEHSPTPHPKKTDNVAFEDCAEMKFVQIEDSPTSDPKKSRNARFEYTPTPHPKKTENMACEHDAATKSVQFEYSPTPHPNKSAEAAAYRFEHPSTPHPNNSSTSGYEADVDWDTHWDNRVWSKQKYPRHAGRRGKLQWTRKEPVE
eukprot:GEMP01023022.1.p1 GENE.GEMP01023022.1~~GEMP01023022.1.p1  ORF type:complete len:594 (+),score=141.66 GEMP01023022.1:183-1964(+)